jgi:Tol biopolymer transport system component
MKKRISLGFLVLIMSVFGVGSAIAQPTGTDSLRLPEEKHFQNMRQLTFGGDNAEAYWSFDGKALVFQRTSVKDGVPCDQIFYGKLPKKNRPFTYKLVSTGKGRTTCAFLTKDNKHVIYASTHLGSADFPSLTAPNTAINTSGRYIHPSIFSWPTSMATS